jgi:hypothetical protein
MKFHYVQFSVSTCIHVFGNFQIELSKTALQLVNNMYSGTKFSLLCVTRFLSVLQDERS